MAKNGPNNENGFPRAHILVVDDDKAIQRLLHQKMKRSGYECSTAGNAQEALKLLDKQDIDVVITDINMPGLRGDKLTQIVKEKSGAAVIIMTAYVEDFTYEKAMRTGASDFIDKPIRLNELIVRLRRVLKERLLLRERDRAERELRDNVDKLRRAINGVVQAMARAVETRDPYTAGHQKQVAGLACAIAREMGLSEDRAEGIRVAGIIHDLGKISVPSEILTKPTRLTEMEFGIIKTHPEAGYDILNSIEFPWPIAQVVLQHHERMDGSGYPQGLSGENILLEARIIGVADVVEAMASHRPYRAGLGIETALQEILRNKGICYDPDVVDACLGLFKDKGFKLGSNGLD
jgi:putative nucleotidyltransferase with HDIG domain